MLAVQTITRPRPGAVFVRIFDYRASGSGALMIVLQDRAPGGSHRVARAASLLPSSPQGRMIEFERLATEDDEIVSQPYATLPGAPARSGASTASGPRIRTRLGCSPAQVLAAAQQTGRLASVPPRPIAESQHPSKEHSALPPDTLWARFAPPPSQTGTSNAGSGRSGHLAVLMDANLCWQPPVTKTLLDEHDEDFLGGKYTIRRPPRTCVPFAAPRPRRLSDDEAMRALLRMLEDDRTSN